MSKVIVLEYICIVLTPSLSTNNILKTVYLKRNKMVVAMGEDGGVEKLIFLCAAKYYQLA